MKYESRLLGRRNPLKRDRGVEYFTDKDMKSDAHPARKKSTLVKIQNVEYVLFSRFLQTPFLLTSDSLCTHHGTSKNSDFANFAKSFAKKLSAAVNKLLSDFPPDDVVRWVVENLGRAHFMDVINLDNRARSVAAAIADILSGNKVFLDDVIVVRTTCAGTCIPSRNCFLRLLTCYLACQVCASMSNPGFVQPLAFITEYLGSDELKAYVEASLKQVAAMDSTVTVESANTAYVRLKAAYDLYQGPMGDSLRTYVQIVAPPPAPSIPSPQPTSTAPPHPTTTTILDTSGPSNPAQSNASATPLRQNFPIQQPISSAAGALSLPPSTRSVATSSPQSVPSSSGASIRSLRKNLDSVKRSYLTLLAQRRRGKGKGVGAVVVPS